MADGRVLVDSSGRAQTSPSTGKARTVEVGGAGYCCCGDSAACKGASCAVRGSYDDPGGGNLWSVQLDGSFRTVTSTTFCLVATKAQTVAVKVTLLRNDAFVNNYDVYLKVNGAYAAFDSGANPIHFG